MLKWSRRITLLVFALVLIVVLAAWWLLRGSLPRLDGELALPGLSAPVTIQRDKLGVVTIDAANETDAARALGFVHAQARYFEMDLMRRTSAGELAELFGPIALETDRRHRVHRMRARAVANLDAIVGDKLPQLRAYTEGVNAGLASLRTRPWPYLLLQQEPAPWRMEDSALAGYAMYFDLQDADGSRELALWKLEEHLPPALFALLAHAGSRWEAPLTGEARGAAVLPDAAQVDLRELPMPEERDAEGAAAWFAEPPAARTASLTPPPAPRAVPLSPAMRERDVGGPPAAWFAGPPAARAASLTPPPAPRAVPLSPAMRERDVGGPPAAWFAEPPAARAASLTPPPAPRAVPLSPAMRERDVGGPPAAWFAGPPATRTASLTPPSASRMVPLSPAMRERDVGGPPAAADLFPGSNNFAVAGALTADGRAIVADDMHLGLRAPNIWFRARLRYPDPRTPGGKVDVQGFTLPGLPAVVVGSNGHVAWAFTNSYVDTADWARVLPCGNAQIPASGCTPIATHHETIRVAGAAAVTMDVEGTAWGPILERQPDGSALALRWTAHLRGSLDFGLGDFARANDLAQALAVADATAIPTQNLLVADSEGRIAWRLLGPLPQRDGACSTQRLVENAVSATSGDAAVAAPAQPHEPCAPWAISTASAPLVADPAGARLWTANSRVVDFDALQRLGDAGYDLGARAQQIRDGLFAKQTFTERDMLAIQLDDRALFLQRWWQLLRDVSVSAQAPALQALADAAQDWEGHAGTDATSYRIVRAWRLAVHDRLMAGLAAPALAALGDEFEMPKLSQFEGVAWPLVTQRPAHLLPRRFASWDALFEDAAVEVRDTLAADGPLAARTWGERNIAHICHPLAGAVPLVGEKLLCMPPDPLPGDGNMPRVAAPAFGASERMVVSPGHEADGIIHMPGGQSGHPLSPFWGAGHDDWVHGRPTPFLPGKTEHTLTLKP